MDDGERLTAQGHWLGLLMLHMAGPRVRSRVEIDDLVQEVFLRAISEGASLPARSDGEAALRRYLARAARSCVFDVVRALRARKRAAQEIPLARSDWSIAGISPGAIPSAQPGPVTLAARNDEETSLMAAFEGLSPEHRRVIGFRQLEGLSAEETGRRMARSASAVHSLYRRALQAWSSAL